MARVKADAPVIEEVEKPIDEAAYPIADKLSTAEIVQRINALLGGIGYTDHNGHFDASVAEIHRLLDLL